MDKDTSSVFSAKSLIHKGGVPLRPHPPDPGNDAAAPLARGCSKVDTDVSGRHRPYQPEPIPSSGKSDVEGILAPGLRRWAERRASRLADEFLRDGAGARLPSEFLDEALKHEPLLARLPATAHQAFMGRILETETGR